MAKRIKIVTIVGARPQFIKAAVVSRVLKKIRSPQFQEILIHTGQHYDYGMSDIFFKDLNLAKPRYCLEVGSHSHGKQTGQMLEKIEYVLQKEKPSLVLVYGDTNSTLAGALAASKLHIPVAHVEAGMRSFNKTMPEEINRVVTDHLSTFLFCSSITAVRNLRKEGIYDRSLKPFRRVFTVGDVMVDSLKFFSKEARKKSKILNSLEIKPKSYFLATIHRSENTDHSEILEIIFKAFNEIAQQGYRIIMPLHPRTQNALKKLPNMKVHSRFTFINPLSYLDMLCLEKNALGICTDSGGVQKEAFLFKVPTLTLRNETEWVETVKSGLNILTPIQLEKIKKNFYSLPQMKRNIKNSYYGTGRASLQIGYFLQKCMLHSG